ncbi:hypothetical protein PYW07_008611 [Mythimna separata]|uniref:sn-1-specific diacylglycerol lipase ABHD11 n=1 Tax=Mythimna separata TaxID=271217 RepID=A0AAD7YD05_MYTSE|nr:hypothetical protein PYW07_008611 [Mythimna separata]
MERRFHAILSQYNILFKQVTPVHRICKRSVVLSYKVLGESTTESDEPPVFLFHGLLGGKRQWEGIGKIILNVTKRSVVAVDLRNHGDSPHVNSHKYEEQAEDILHLFQKLGVKQASLLGHSMGGKAAMCLALMAPLRITGVLVVDISPVTTSKHYRDDFPKILAAMKAVDFKNPKEVLPAKIEAKKQLEGLSIDDHLMKVILDNIKLKTDNTIGWSCNIDVLLNDIKHIASFPNLKDKTYFGPTLLLGGQMSELIPPDDLTEIRAKFPRAVITYIHKARHNVHVDDPRSFLERAIAFIRTHHYRQQFKPPTLSK